VLDETLRATVPVCLALFTSALSLAFLFIAIVAFPSSSMMLVDNNFLLFMVSSVKGSPGCEPAADAADELMHIVTLSSRVCLH